MNTFRDDQMIKIVGEGALNESRNEHYNGHNVSVLEEGSYVDKLNLMVLTGNQNCSIVCQIRAAICY